MHINMQAILCQVERMNPEQLNQLQESILRRRHQLGHKPVKPLSTVVERRNYRHGILQLERRAYRRKDGGRSGFRRRSLRTRGSSRPSTPPSPEPLLKARSQANRSTC
jgi:hypothetical protein